MNENTRTLRIGAAFAITVGIGYAGCALVFGLFPDAASMFMNALFHGLDFRRPQAGTAAFSFAGFAYALAVLVAWAFLLGTLFAWIQRRFA